MEYKEYEKLTEVEKLCFRFFRDSISRSTWAILGYAIKRFSELSEKRVHELARAADPEGYRRVKNSLLEASA